MPVVTKDKALDLLTDEVEEKLCADELLEVYNEVLHDDACTEGQAPQDPSPLREQLVEHIRSGLGIDQVIDLWGVIFPKHRNVWYDEEEERLHYNEEAEAVPSE